MSLSPTWRVILSWVGSGIVGGFAFATALWFVTPGSLRDWFIVLIWPTVIIAGTIVAWRWLGKPVSPTRDRAYVALTEVLEAGERLGERMRQVTASEADEAERLAWKVRIGDWVSEAERVLGEVAPARLPAFRADLIWNDTSRREGPSWLADDLLDVELQIERLRQIRATL